MSIPAKSTPIPDRIAVRRALLSVFDKSGLVDFAGALARHGVALASTGGTAGTLSAAGLVVEDVADITGFPEIMDGRVKTLHPKIHGGLLAVRDDPGHAAALKAESIAPIDLVAVSLYPFESVLASGADQAALIENIDIGGPAMIRAAAKNHAYVTVVVDPADYGEVIAELDAHGGTLPYELRRRLAAKAYGRTAQYDAMVANWFASSLGVEAPAYRTLGGVLKQTMRYGENPHQTAAFYRSEEQRPGVASAVQLQGKALSYNNINDTDAAYECVAEFDPGNTAACVIVKHANPCGVASAASLGQAYRRALSSDPVSAFGGIVAVNRTLDEETATEIAKLFVEVVIAPEISQAARDILSEKKNVRLLVAGGLPDPRRKGLSAKTVAGGLLVQSRDDGACDPASLKVVTRRAPDAAETADLVFAFTVAKHVKSNAIVYARDGATVGIGAGQMSRVDSARIAAQKAVAAARAQGLTAPLTQGSVVASDAFFPFADGLVAAIEAGARAVIQPGGSVRDEEVIAAADAAGIAMVFTGMRHFRH